MSHHKHHKDYKDPKWQQAMALRMDFNYAMADFLGAENGLQDADFKGIFPQLEQIDADMKQGRETGELGFLDLPYQEEPVKEIKKLAKSLKEWCWDLALLGIGGSALGAQALFQALCHPQHNLFSLARRQYNSRLLLADNIDPDYFYGLLDASELRRLVINVISKSGNTAETLAQFLFLYGVLKGRLGDEKARERLVLTTDPEQGELRRLARQKGFRCLNIPPQAGGRFSVFSPVGLFPAAMVGIEVEELLAGAKFMDATLQAAAPDRNLAYRLAMIYYLFAARKNRSIQVLMPYASSLAGVAQWYCQLWAESLGKKVDLSGKVVNTGSTPIRALGATDQHSQLQLYLEGPADKIITFIEVDRFQHTLAIPSLYPDLADLNYLSRHSINDLLAAEKKATAFNLVRAERPNLTLRLPEINAFTIGQLLYLFQVATVAAGGLFGVNPLDQPGVESVKLTTYGLMGRPGFESSKEEFETDFSACDNYMI